MSKISNYVQYFQIEYHRFSLDLLIIQLANTFGNKNSIMSSGLSDGTYNSTFDFIYLNYLSEPFVGLITIIVTPTQI